MSQRREELVRLARAAEERGLNRGSSGNLSVRTDAGMLITPSAVPYRRMGPEELVPLALDGTVLEGDGTPSTEWRIHAGVYRSRPEIGAVLHAHPPYSTTLACLHRGIPAFHYLVGLAGGDSIRCARYATFGTAELADRVVEALEGRTACLMANHGLTAVGATGEAALAMAADVEELAAAYWRAIQVEEPPTLSAEEMAEVRERLSGYRSG